MHHTSVQKGAHAINDYKAKAKKLNGYLTYGDESVKLQELSLYEVFILKEPIAVPSSCRQLIREHGKLCHNFLTNKIHD